MPSGLNRRAVKQVVHFVSNRCRVDLQSVGAWRLHCSSLDAFCLQNESCLGTCVCVCVCEHGLYLLACDVHKAHGLSNVGLSVLLYVQAAG